MFSGHVLHKQLLQLRFLRCNESAVGNGKGLKNNTALSKSLLVTGNRLAQFVYVVSTSISFSQQQFEASRLSLQFCKTRST